MDKKIAILTDTNSGITPEQAVRYGIYLVSMPVIVVDNHRISVTLRQSVLEAKHLADQGITAREIVEYLEQDGLEASIYVAVNTLEYLKRSGRVTAAGAAIGTILNLKPELLGRQNYKRHSRK